MIEELWEKSNGHEEYAVRILEEVLRICEDGIGTQMTSAGASAAIRMKFGLTSQLRHKYGMLKDELNHHESYWDVNRNR